MRKLNLNSLPLTERLVITWIIDLTLSVTSAIKDTLENDCLDEEMIESLCMMLDGFNTILDGIEICR